MILDARKVQMAYPSPWDAVLGSSDATPSLLSGRDCQSDGFERVYPVECEGGVCVPFRESLVHN